MAQKKPKRSAKRRPSPLTLGASSSPRRRRASSYADLHSPKQRRSSAWRTGIHDGDQAGTTAGAKPSAGTSGNDDVAALDERRSTSGKIRRSFDWVAVVERLEAEVRELRETTAKGAKDARALRAGNKALRKEVSELREKVRKLEEETQEDGRAALVAARKKNKRSRPQLLSEFAREDSNGGNENGGGGSDDRIAQAAEESKKEGSITICRTRKPGAGNIFGATTISVALSPGRRSPNFAAANTGTSAARSSRSRSRSRAPSPSPYAPSLVPPPEASVIPLSSPAVMAELFSALEPEKACLTTIFLHYARESVPSRRRRHRRHRRPRLEQQRGAPHKKRGNISPSSSSSSSSPSPSPPPLPLQSPSLRVIDITATKDLPFRFMSFNNFLTFAREFKVVNLCTRSELETVFRSVAAAAAAIEADAEVHAMAEDEQMSGSRIRAGERSAAGRENWFSRSSVPSPSSRRSSSPPAASSADEELARLALSIRRIKNPSSPLASFAAPGTEIVAGQTASPASAAATALPLSPATALRSPEERRAASPFGARGPTDFISSSSSSSSSSPTPFPSHFPSSSSASSAASVSSHSSSSAARSKTSGDSFLTLDFVDFLRALSVLALISFEPSGDRISDGNFRLRPPAVASSSSSSSPPSPSPSPPSSSRSSTQGANATNNGTLIAVSPAARIVMLVRFLDQSGGLAKVAAADRGIGLDSLTFRQR